MTWAASPVIPLPRRLPPPPVLSQHGTWGRGFVHPMAGNVWHRDRHPLYHTSFITPSFVVDLSVRGGKRLAATFKFYDRDVGRSRFAAPGAKGRVSIMTLYPRHGWEELRKF
jgi:hypothetical protein